MNQNTSQSEPKLRPYLSLPQIEHIISLCMEGMVSNTNPLNKEIILSLQLVSLKAKAGITKPAYIPAGKKISDSLGMNSDALESYRAALFQEWLINPTGLSLQNLELVREYRYEKGLLPEQEKISYEQELMTKISSPI